MISQFAKTAGKDPVLAIVQDIAMLIELLVLNINQVQKHDWQKSFLVPRLYKTSKTEMEEGKEGMVGFCELGKVLCVLVYRTRKWITQVAVTETRYKNNLKLANLATNSKHHQN